MGAQSLQSCPTLGNPMDYSLPGSSLHGLLQARVVMPSSRGSSWPSNQTHNSWISCIAGRFFTTKPQGKPHTRHKDGNLAQPDSWRSLSTDLYQAASSVQSYHRNNFPDPDLSHKIWLRFSFRFTYSFLSPSFSNSVVKNVLKTMLGRILKKIDTLNRKQKISLDDAGMKINV